MGASSKKGPKNALCGTAPNVSLEFPRKFGGLIAYACPSLSGITSHILTMKAELSLFLDFHLPRPGTVGALAKKGPKNALRATAPNVSWDFPGKFGGAYRLCMPQPFWNYKPNLNVEARVILSSSPYFHLPRPGGVGASSKKEPKNALHGTAPNVSWDFPRKFGELIAYACPSLPEITSQI